MTPEQMNELLEAAKPAVIEALKRELKDGITWEAKNETMKIVREHTEKWVKENILPEVTKILIENKEGMISVAAKLGPAIVDELVISATATVKKNLEQSWTRKKIFDDLIG